MNELIRQYGPDARILNLGSGVGTFLRGLDRQLVVNLDLDYQAAGGNCFVAADAAELPFADGSFDLVIANHSFEHIERLEDCLREIRRVASPKCGLFVSVPDASTVTDKLYRWLARGGGHVNPFVDANSLAARIAAGTNLRHTGTRTLCSSLSFLNRKNARTRPPIRLMMLGGGTETSLRAWNLMSRLGDSIFKTRSSVYGWAFYFGSLQPSGIGEVWSNVCIRCGGGIQPNSASASLHWYRCPNCQTRNIYFDDRHLRHLVTR